MLGPQSRQQQRTPKQSITMLRHRLPSPQPRYKLWTCPAPHLTLRWYADSSLGARLSVASTACCPDCAHRAWRERGMPARVSWAEARQRAWLLHTTLLHALIPCCVLRSSRAGTRTQPHPTPPLPAERAP